MSAFIGTSQPNNYYIGNTALSALYVGTNKIWPVGQEFAHYDFGNIASFSSPSQSFITNISANRNSVAGVFSTMSLHVPGPQITFADPSGSGIMARVSASTPSYGNYIQPVGGTSLNPAASSTFTFETWVRPYTKKVDGNTTLSGPQINPIFSMYSTWTLGVSSVNTNDGSMLCLQNNNQSASTAPNVVDFNQWNHLVYTIQRNFGSNVTTFTMYKNGVQQPITKNNFTGNLSVVSNTPYISPAAVNSVLIFGLYDISQYRFYNKVLDGAEVDALFQATRARYSI
jgi:hypothetical protein